MKKKILLLLLIVIALVSMSAISAADVDDNNQTLALDSSSDISKVSASDANVLAMNNDDGIQGISDSDDVLSDDDNDGEDEDDKDPIIIKFDEVAFPEQTEGYGFNIHFQIWDASGDEPVPFFIDDDDDRDFDFEVELEIDDEVLQNISTSSDDDLEGEFTLENGLGPGVWEAVLKTEGSDDFGPCESGIRIFVKPAPGSRIVFTEFDPNLEQGNVITFEYNETLDLNFKAISESTGAGLHNLSCLFQLDNNPSYEAFSSNDGELSFTFNNLTVGNHVFKLTPSRESIERGLTFEDLVINIKVPKISVELTVDPEDLDLEVNDSDTIVAELNPSEAGNVTFTSSNNNVVTVDDDGNVTAVGEGNAVIIVSFPGNDMYEAAEARVPVTVSKIETSIVVDPEYLDLDLYVGDEDQIIAELDPEEAGKINFTSSNESIVTVDKEGKFKAISEGSAAITLSFDGNYKYKAAENVTITVTVSKIETSIDLDSDNPLELEVGDEDKIIAELDPSEAGDLIYNSSNDTVVTVDNQGNVKANNEGSATITISFAGDDKYAAAEDVIISVTVSKIETEITIYGDEWELLYDNHLGLLVGYTDTIFAELDPEEAGNITFASSNETVATVDDEGKVEAINVGESSITLSFDGDNKYAAAKTVTVIVIVSKDDTSITIHSDDSLEMFVGDVSPIDAELDPEEAGNLTYNSSNTNVATVDSYGKVRAVGEGEAVITVLFAGNYEYRSSKATVTVKVSKYDTEIDLLSDDSLNLEVGDADSIVAVLYLGNDEGEITFTSSNRSVVTVDNKGHYKAVGEGEAEITLSYAGDYMYKAAENVTVTVSVSKKDTEIRVIDDSLELYVGDEGRIYAELDPEEAGNIIYNSSDMSVVTVDNGKVKGVGKGEANITISFAGNNMYKASETTVSVVVNKKDVRIELISDDTLDLFVGDEEKIIAYIIVDDGSEMIPFDLFDSLEYNVSSDDGNAEDIVEVDEQGNVKAVGEGEATIVISFGGNDLYNAAENVTVSVTVSMIETTINLDSEDYLELFVGDEDSITAELDPEEAGNITFTSSDESVVTVDSEGNLVAVGEGQAEITLSFAGDERYTAAENVTVSVTVSKIETTITVDEDYLELNVGDEDTISAELDPEEAGNMTFTSSDETVVTVDSEGNLVAVGEGEANITISFSGDNKYMAAEDITVSVSVSMIETSINLNSEDSLELFVGDEDSIIAVLDPEEAGNITFTSSDETVVTVDSKGNLVAVGEGQAEITLSFAGDERYTAAENVTVSVTVSKIETTITVDEDYLELNVGDEDSISAELDPEEAGNITFTSSDETVVTVDNQGNLIAVGEGEANITISFSGDNKYAAAEDVTVSVTVSMIETSINLNSEDYLELFVDDEDSIIAELDPEEAGNITFTSSDETVVTVDNQGNLIAVGEGQAEITLSFAGDERYKAAENVTVSVTVSKIETAITVDEDYLELNVGDEDSIVAELNPEEAGNITFASSDESVVAVDSEGNLVAVGEGEANITISFAGNDKYAAAEDVIITVTVSKIETTIRVNKDYFELFVADEDTIFAELNPEEAGNITFASSDESVVAVDSEGNLVAVSEGVAVITVSFDGDDKYVDCEATVAVTVSKIDTSIRVDKNYLELFVGDKESITSFLVIDYDSGMIPIIHLNSLSYASSNESVVTVDDEGNVKAVGNGKALITVSFAGDYKYNAAEDKIIPVTVSLKDASIGAGPKSLDLHVGENNEIYYFTIPEDLDVKLTSTNESIVTVKEDNGFVVVTAVGEGNAVITLTVGDDVVYVMNSTTISVTVSKIEAEIIADDLLILNVGDETIIDLTTTPDGLDVIYESNDTSVAVVDNYGIITAVSNGTALITIKIKENDLYEASPTIVTVIVYPKDEKEKEELNITVDADDIIVGEDAIIVIFGLEDATGTIIITVDGENYTVPIYDGEAILNVPDLDVGNYIIPIYYPGDDNYDPVNIYINLTVGEDKSDVISTNDVTKYYGDDERYVVVITDYEGKPVAGKNVSFLINGVPYTRTTNNDGFASVALNLASGIYNITVTVDNKTTTSQVNILSTVNGTDVVKVFRNGTQYYATFRDCEGNYLKAGTTVRFNINGIMYDREVFGDKGLAKLNINLGAGEYVITAMNLVTGENTANKIKVISRIIENKDITKYYKNGTQYTVKLINSDGTAVGAGAVVTFNINGVLYTRTTNESGIARLNINLQPGDYIITAEYMGCKVSNNIKVLSVLFANDMSMRYHDGSKFTANLVDGQGKAYVGQTVQFNINGVLYNRVTDSLGQAKLNINLMAGEYIITSSYNGSNIANTITIAA